MRRRTGLLLALAALASLPAAAARADDPGTLGVLGMGSVELAPDVGTFDAQVVRTAASSGAARTATNTRLQGIVKALVALQIPRSDITTTAVSLQRNRTREAKTHRLRISYTAAGAFAVRVQGADKVGSALDAAGNHGASSIDGATFTFSDALSTQGRQQAERDALTDARARADAAAASQGQAVTGVRSIELDPGTESPAESQSATAAPATPASASSGGVSKVPVPVLPGRQEFDATVRVVYTIGPAA